MVPTALLLAVSVDCYCHRITSLKMTFWFLVVLWDLEVIMNIMEIIPISVLLWILSSNKWYQSAIDELKNPYRFCTESEGLIPVMSLPSMLGFYWEFKCFCYVEIHWLLHLIWQPCSVLTHCLGKQRVLLLEFEDTETLCSCTGCMDCCKLLNFCQ